MLKKGVLKLGNFFSTVSPPPPWIVVIAKLLCVTILHIRLCDYIGQESINVSLHTF